MESEGWIKLHRQFLKWEWHDAPETAHLFVILLLLANHEDEKWHGLTIQRGQILTSRDKLAVHSGLTVQQVRTSLARLEQTGEICRKTTNRFSVITISNYDRYQVREAYPQPTNNQQTTSNQPTVNQQSTTNKNDKNEKNISISHSIEEQLAENFSGRWRYLSSVQRSFCGFDKDKMAEMKREIFRQEVENFAQEVGMNSQQVKAFVRHWTEHNPGSDKIRAEGYDPFNTKERMISWMERDRSAVGQPARPAQGQRANDRLQNIIDERNKFQQALHGFYNRTSAGSTPDYQGEQ